MDDLIRPADVISSGHLGHSGLTSVKSPAFIKKPRACSLMDRSVNSAPAQERAVGRIDQGLRPDVQHTAVIDRYGRSYPVGIDNGYHVLIHHYPLLIGIKDESRELRPVRTALEKRGCRLVYHAQATFGRSIYRKEIFSRGVKLYMLECKPGTDPFLSPRDNFHVII